MAEVINVVHLETHTEFNLSDKPDLLCKIDTDDFYKLVDHTTCWYIHIATKCKFKRPYIRRTLWPSKKQEHLHRVVMDAGDFCRKTSIVDHKAITETIDNRKSNLRITDASGNAKNRTISSEYEPYKNCAICFIKKRGSFQSYLNHDGKPIYIASNKSIVQLKKKIDIKLEQLKKEGRI